MLTQIQNPQKMRVQILTSCTGEKIFSPEAQLKRDDFLYINDIDNFRAREDQLIKFSTAAQDLYSGQQHVRLMRGVDFFRNRFGIQSVELSILSAGYGLINGLKKIVPYECTFQGMKVKELSEWAKHLNIPQNARSFFSSKADLTLVLLGESYLRTLALDENVSFASPTIFFTSNKAQRHIKGQGKNIRAVPLSSAEASRFSCALVGLKGELAHRVLSEVAKFPEELIATLMNPDTEILDLLEQIHPTEEAPSKPTKNKSKSTKTTRSSNTSDVISIPQSWWNKSHRKQLMYFMPDWDDLVDPDYDFETDAHSGGTGNWANQVYAHQLYPEPNYDGLLVSKAVAEQSKKKRELIHEMGVHQYLRVPSSFPIMGDCGAFSYVSEDVPPYNTPDIIEYYTRLGFNYGVSIDHLLFGAADSQGEKERYQLTIQNAEDFIREHTKLNLPWIPVGAIQGMDPGSFAEAARKYVSMGYEYLALGGLVRTKNEQIFAIAQAVNDVIPAHVKVHLFGVARPKALTTLIQLGISSVDSASPLRQAWMREREGYLTESGPYAAIRIPDISRSSRVQKSLAEQGIEEAAAKQMENTALRAIRAYARYEMDIDSCLSDILDYEEVISPRKKDMSELYQKTLADRPWEDCGCSICRQVGVEVVIFRGNNRNRRRGFHNSFVFYQMMQRILLDEPVHDSWVPQNGTSYQLALPTSHPTDGEA